MSYKIIDLPDLGRAFNATDIMEVSANGLGSYKVNIGEFTLGGENYIFVNSNGTPTENGQAVKDAYVAAQAMTPNGAALSETNRVVILLAPGLYDFDEATYGPFQVNTSFIDFQSLSGERDVYFSSIDVQSYQVFGINARFSGIDTTVNSYYGHQAFAICTGGDPNENIVVKNCKGGAYSFSSFSSGFVGTYEDCEATDFSFVSTGDGIVAPLGISSSGSLDIFNYGTIKNCKSNGFGSFCSSYLWGAASFANNYGTIESCVSRDGYSFCYSPYMAYNSGTIISCQSPRNSFVSVSFDGIGNGQAVNQGTIQYCSATANSSNYSFVSYEGDNLSMDSAINAGLIDSCKAYGGTSFTINPVVYVGTNYGQMINCDHLGGGGGFCGSYGTNYGMILQCTSYGTAFCNLTPSNINNNIWRCSMVYDSWTTGVTGGGKVVLGIDTTGVVNF